MLGSLTVMLNLQGEGMGSLYDVDDLTNTFSKVGCLQIYLSSIDVIMQWKVFTVSWLSWKFWCLMLWVHFSYFLNVFTSLSM